MSHKCHKCHKSVIREWNKLDIHERSSTSFSKALLSFIKPTEKKIYNIYDRVGTKLLTRLRLVFRHLREHKFQHNFENNLDPIPLR